ncbi:MAG: hypothetical protein II778_09630 [Anaerovibrio sp.]|nr:hypothetical protein [Anaerovibrio sp.]
MHKKHISAGLASLLVCAGVMVSWPNSSYAKTAVNLERDSVVYNREDSSAKPRFQYEPEEGVRIGYIVVGDDVSLLDENTMGYIRRMLHTKFPGYRYPPDRLGKDIDGKPTYRLGRRNTGDSYILTEAHDVLALEFEKLENMYRYNAKRNAESGNYSTEYNNSSTPGTTVNNINIEVGNKDIYDVPGYSFGQNSTVHKNSFAFTDYLSTLPKDDYVKFVRELEEEGMGGYDYLVMFNIHPIRTQVKQKALGNSRWSDFRLSVRAIDVRGGKYIDRGEYIKRGYSGVGGVPVPILGTIGPSPSWRKAMRRAIIDAMIESFDNIPIGKYSICDNPYCVRRQDELRMERVFGRSHRHCVKHCHDNTICNDHMVSYQIDADLPESYVNNEKDPIFTRE